MALTDIQQIHKLLDEKKHILIALKQNASGDAIASAVAVLLFLERMGKRAAIVTDTNGAKEKFSFLPGVDRITNSLGKLRTFLLTIDIEKTGLDELSYDVKDDKLRIFITPKQGMLGKDEVRTAQSDFRYDLIITLNTPDLDSLGGLFHNNTEFFFKTPVINIDHASTNEHYGHINMVDLTATSTAEVLSTLVEKIGAAYIDEKIATALLTGMIVATRSFKTTAVKPTTLSVASKLMSMGADREKIIHHLYRTRTIPTLRLWGTVLTHLQSEKDTNIVWSTITRDDLVRSGASEHDLSDIIDELISNSPEAKLILLFHEHAGTNGVQAVHVLLHVEKGYDASDLLRPFGGKGDKVRAAAMIEGKTLVEVTEEVVRKIKEQMKS